MGAPHEQHPQSCGGEILPPQPVTALVYTAAAHSANIWTPESAHQMEWVRRMNSIRSRAEEIVLTELVYSFD